MSKYKGSAKIVYDFQESNYCTEGHRRSYSVSVDCFWGGDSESETRAILKDKGKEKLAQDVGYAKIDCYSYNSLDSDFEIYKCDE